MRRTSHQKSLKSSVALGLVAFAALDLVSATLFSMHQGMEWNYLAIVARGVVSPAVAAIVLLCAAIVSPSLKARLVYWRWHDALPGHRAFSELAGKDPRIDLARLKRHVGSFPTIPKAQNARWYSLYKLVENEDSVLDANRAFLLYRDLSAATLPLAIFFSVSVLWLTNSLWRFASCMAVFALQYVLAAIAARNAGERLVSNVLALHSARKIPQTASRNSTSN